MGLLGSLAGLEGSTGSSLLQRNKKGLKQAFAVNIVEQFKTGEETI